MMKADVYFMGKRTGQVEVSENSILGRLASGDIAAALAGLRAMRDEINEIAGPGTCRIGMGIEEADDDD